MLQLTYATSFLLLFVFHISLMHHYPALLRRQALNLDRPVLCAVSDSLQDHHSYMRVTRSTVLCRGRECLVY